MQRHPSGLRLYKQRETLAYLPHHRNTNHPHVHLHSHGAAAGSAFIGSLGLSVLPEDTCTHRLKGSGIKLPRLWSDNNRVRAEKTQKQHFRHGLQQ